MSSFDSSITQVQPQDQSCECSHRTNTEEVKRTSILDFASWSDAGQAVQRQGSSPFKVQTRGRFTIIEEEGSSPKLSFKLPSFGGSLSGQKSAAAGAAGSTLASPGPAAYKAASTPGMGTGTTKAGHLDSSSGNCQPPSSIRKPAAGALQMPGT